MCFSKQNTRQTHAKHTEKTHGNTLQNTRKHTKHAHFFWGGGPAMFLNSKNSQLGETHPTPKMIAHYQFALAAHPIACNKTHSTAFLGRSVLGGQERFCCPTRRRGKAPLFTTRTSLTGKHHRGGIGNAIRSGLVFVRQQRRAAKDPLHQPGE